MAAHEDTSAASSMRILWLNLNNPSLYFEHNSAAMGS
jgi:hypothetical protein